MTRIRVSIGLGLLPVLLGTILSETQGATEKVCEGAERVIGNAQGEHRGLESRHDVALKNTRRLP